MAKVDTQGNSISMDINDIFQQGLKIKDPHLFNVLDRFCEFEFSNENTHFVNQMHCLDQDNILQMMAVADVCINNNGGSSSEYIKYLPYPIANHPSEIDEDSVNVNIGYENRVKILECFNKIDEILKSDKTTVPEELKLEMEELLGQANFEIVNVVIYNDVIKKMKRSQPCISGLVWAASETNLI